MKIKTLIENTAACPGLCTEAGLSMYIEALGKKILFDTGMSGDFTDNAQKMGVDLTAVDLVVVSHGHDDHGGGLKRFLQLNQTAPIYINQHAFRSFFTGDRRNISLAADLKEHPRVILTGDRLSLGEGLELFTGNGLVRSHKMGHFGLTTLSQGAYVPDDFRHEQYLRITEQGKTVLLSGCSHKGILNIMEWAQCDVLLGGFHFMRLGLEGEDRAYLENAARQLMTYPTTYYTCHCTGLKQYAVLKEIMGEQLQYTASGDEIDL